MDDVTQFCVEEAVFERVTLHDRQLQADAASVSTESFLPDHDGAPPVDPELEQARAQADAFRYGRAG